jgi:hypothetical protein
MDHTEKMAELEKRLQFLEGKEAERERSRQEALNWRNHSKVISHELVDAELK